MAFNPSYLFKFGNYTFPDTYMAEGGYEIKPNQRQDLDSYTDQTGLTHRNAIPHSKTQITITTRSLKWDEVYNLMTGLVSNYINDRERDANCTYFDTEYMRMSTGHFYLDPSQSTKIQHVGKDYDAITFTFVEY